jgi:hypothetical protein
MFKLNAVSLDGNTKFEQVFQNYVSMREKEKELQAQGLTTVCTPMTKEQHEKYSQELLNKVVGLYNNALLN